MSVNPRKIVTPGAFHSLVIEKKIPDGAVFTGLVMRRNYVLWRCALVCEKLRCESWRPWGWGETSAGLEGPHGGRWHIETGHE